MGNGLATCQLRMINAKLWEVPILFIKTFLGNLRRVLIQYTKYKKQLRTNLIAEFELTFYWGGVLSCFSWIRQDLGICSNNDLSSQATSSTTESSSGSRG